MSRKKEKDEEVFGMLWQGNSKYAEEKNLQEAIEHHIKKYSHKPTKILINREINLPSYDGIVLIKDKQMYTKTLFLLMP